jgi:Zn finger protein HypA/HybF involved in hydrogenase expression
MSDNQQTNIQKKLGDRPGEVMCTTCLVVMSRRWLKKPDTETGVTEAIYRCPKCDATVSRWIKN